MECNLYSLCTLYLLCIPSPFRHQVQVVGISRKRKRHGVREVVKVNSRRNTTLDPHAGGFSFFDVPSTAESATTKHKEVIDDSLQRAARGLSSIFGADGSINVEAVEAEKTANTTTPGTSVEPESTAKSISTTPDREGSVKSIDLESIFATNGDRQLLAQYPREDIVRAWWKELEPKVRAEPKIKFNELIATHAVALNIDLDEEVINDLKNEYNQTVVDIFQSSATQLAQTHNGCATATKSGQSVWAQLVENLQSEYPSQNVQALEFVLSVLEEAEDAEDNQDDNEDDDEGNGINDSENDDGDDTKMSPKMDKKDKNSKKTNKNKIPKNVESATEKKAKCLSILMQNSDALSTILNSDRAQFVDHFTRILCLILPDDMDADKAKKRDLNRKKKKIKNGLKNGDGTSMGSNSVGSDSHNISDGDSHDDSNGEGTDSVNDSVDDSEEDQEAMDQALKVFGFRFASDYMFAMMRHSLKNTEIIHMMSLMARKCIVYQLAGCHRLEQLLKKYNILALLTAKRSRKRTQRKRRKDGDESAAIQASKQLAMEVLSLVVTLTMGIGTYPATTREQEDVIDEVEQNPEEMLFNGFPLDLLLETVSAVLEWNVNSSKPNVKVFELCCDILVNIVAVDEPLIFKLLSTNLRRSKRIIFVLHKTYGDSKGLERLEAECNETDTLGIGIDLDDDTRLRVIQPYDFRAPHDASWEPYGISVDVSQREDELKLSNVDCRRSIGDILLRHIDFLANYQGKFAKHPLCSAQNKEQRRWQLGIGRVFFEALSSGHLVKVSWGYNKPLNHYHRSNGAMAWVTGELLYQHAIDGRQHPDRHSQPRRHFRVCWLLQTLFDPLVWDYERYSELLKKLCAFCRAYNEQTGVELATWRKLKHSRSAQQGKEVKDKSKDKETGKKRKNSKHSKHRKDTKQTKHEKDSNAKQESDELQDWDLMNSLISNLWNEVVAKCKAVMRRQRGDTPSPLEAAEVALLEALSECVLGQKSSSIDVGGMVSALEQMVRDKGRSILNGRGRQSVDEMVSVVLRSNTLHFLVGLTQMEATCGDTRNWARRAIRAVVWSVDKKRKKLLKKGQIPFLPTIGWCYREWGFPTQSDELCISKEQSVLVVGDGNLSFGRALCRLFGAPSTKSKLMRAKKEREDTNQREDDLSDLDCGARNIVVTAYESAMELLSRYPHSGSVVAEIVDRGGLVLYGIDATDLASTLSASYTTYGGDKRPFPLFGDAAAFESFAFDVIIWNFPHAMDDAFKPGVNGDLVEQFLVSAQQILAKKGQIHVTLHINHQIDHEVGSTGAQSRVYPQFTSWKIGERAHRKGLRCVDRIDLNHRRYPGYAIKNVQGNPFNIVKAETYIFQRADDL